MKRALAAVALAGALVLTIAGCGTYPTSVEEIKKAKEFVRVCEEAGGRASYDGLLRQICVMESE